MPNRTIKESALTSESLAAISADAERLFWRLVLIADDFGRFLADPSVIKARCFPLKVDNYKTERVQKWLQEIVNVDSILIYKVKGRLYGQFKNWEENNGKRRAKFSKCPDPAESEGDVPKTQAISEILQSEQNQDDSNCEQLHADARICASESRHETRESRHENKPAPSVLIIPPDLVSKEVWTEYLAHRKRKRAAMTPEVARRLTTKLEHLHNLGHDPNEVLRKCIDRNWTGLEISWIENEGAGNGKQPTSAEPKGFAGIRAALARKQAGANQP